MATDARALFLDEPNSSRTPGETALLWGAAGRLGISTTAAGKPVSLVFHPNAGHRVLLPGETTLRSTRHAHGGNDTADMALGRAAWNAIEALIGPMSL